MNIGDIKQVIHYKHQKDEDGIYQVLLHDNTMMHVPLVLANRDYKTVLEWAKHMQKDIPITVRDTPKTIENPMAQMQEQLNTLDERDAKQSVQLQAEVAALQQSIIETRSAMMAIKGFMMEIPNIQKSLEEIKELLEIKD